MRRFVAGETDVLVATSVIEVGIDVPNATVMLIEGAERYGVSQLHQLRGRVGRGEHESYCILFAEGAGELARRRLEALAGERDGFKLAEVDLALRGEGEILGTRQHGLPRFSVASLPEDTPALLAARQEVLELLRRHGSLEAPELGPLMDAARDALRRRGGRADPAMRVVAGELGGRRLVAPRGWRVRPTSDRVREAIFSALGRHRGRPGARPLLRHRRARDRGDLARRRGARPSSTATSGRRSATSATSAQDRVDLVRADVVRWLRATSDRATSNPPELRPHLSRPPL